MRPPAPNRDGATGLGYQPALDGLRAVSVIAVVLYHAGIGWMHGGFFGVEVFFVISGFLITSLLLDERVATGTNDLGRFWMRRARRLLPALIVVLLTVSAWSSDRSRSSRCAGSAGAPGARRACSSGSRLPSSRWFGSRERTTPAG
jgi:peptidoglycan/LPS O-acetylase OafA/YrhL